MAGRARDTCTKYRINVKITVPHCLWQNLAKASIPKLKKSVQRTIQRTGTPLRLWPYCMEWCAAVRRLTASSIPELDGRTPAKYIESSTPDISSYAMFDWYQPLFFQSRYRVPSQKECHCALGVAEDYTDVMAYVVLAVK
jgi:hypothetical protein